MHGTLVYPALAGGGGLALGFSLRQVVLLSVCFIVHMQCGLQLLGLRLFWLERIWLVVASFWSFVNGLRTSADATRWTCRLAR